ncbi:hypothetical protein CEXT_665481 [Caerostris extrusa]|uniref:Uncharacterized protein n=1 Tax=Caerostris extrusa TaxID=172846 RepID=A0AAV4USU5_CAEEX|nr:hypothetical protein CEXT_665481 [Caerostris extrusa]
MGSVEMQLPPWMVCIPPPPLVTARIRGVLRSIDCSPTPNGVCARHVTHSISFLEGTEDFLGGRLENFSPICCRWEKKWW